VLKVSTIREVGLEPVTNITGALRNRKQNLDRMSLVVGTCVKFEHTVGVYLRLYEDHNYTFF